MGRRWSKLRRGLALSFPAAGEPHAKGRIAVRGRRNRPWGWQVGHDVDERGLNESDYSFYLFYKFYLILYFIVELAQGFVNFEQMNLRFYLL
jgi:hypothetical protein